MEFVDQTFKHQEIDLDFNSFKVCKFIECQMNYRGFGPVEMGGCSFENVKWNFSGAAGNVLGFMTSIYHGAGQGGKQLIDSTFENIRKGLHPSPEGNSKK